MRKDVPQLTKKDDQHSIFVVDDEPEIRDALRLLLESVGYYVECFATADEFLNQFEPTRKGCLILDVKMPSMSGMTLQEKLTSMKALLSIIMISGHGEIPMVVKAVQNGAIDFLQKPFSGQELLNCISNALEVNEQRHNHYRIKHNAQKKFMTLTPREHEIFLQVIKGKFNKVIAYELHISTRTVEIHRAKTMEKMGAKNLSDLINLSYLLEI
ncbi:MAG: response regulator transcription factor [Gammaproteobacteria bacterium]|nr:response regulator transcription factor [Gammaproteobacteria bacterium]